jgi:hypothetical protein
VPRFRVTVRGDNAVIRVDQAPATVGFFATRAVDADSAEQAASAALASVRMALRDSITNDPDEVTLTTEEVEVASWWWRRFRREMGLVFFPADSAQDHGVRAEAAN